MSIDARVEEREHFVEHALRRSADALDVASAEVEGLDLLDHDDAGHGFAIGDRHVEGMVATRVRDGTGDCRASRICRATGTAPRVSLF